MNILSGEVALSKLILPPSEKRSHHENMPI